VISFVNTESFEIPTVPRGKGGKKINITALKEFWTGIGDYAGQRGCYVFSMRAGRGEKPWYVGKASRQTFSIECFASHKVGIYNDVLGELKGIPRLTFVIPNRERGAWPMATIDEVEEYLIGYAASRNPKIANKRKLPHQKWTIQGVVPASRGAPSSDAASFKKLMGI